MLRPNDKVRAETSNQLVNLKVYMKSCRKGDRKSKARRLSLKVLARAGPGAPEPSALVSALFLTHSPAIARRRPSTAPSTTVIPTTSSSSTPFIPLKPADPRPRHLCRRPHPTPTTLSLIKMAPKVRRAQPEANVNAGPQSEDGLVFGVAHIFASYVLDSGGLEMDGDGYGASGRRREEGMREWARLRGRSTREGEGGNKGRDDEEEGKRLHRPDHPSVHPPPENRHLADKISSIASTTPSSTSLICLARKPSPESPVV
jgi:hypothetical protein